MMHFSKFKALTVNFIFFLIFCSATVQAQVDDPGYTEVTAFEKYIHAKCKEVIESGKTTDKLTKNDLADLPVGIARQVGNTTYVIAIDSAYRAERGGWFFSVYASVTFPGTNKPIAFAAKNIAFNKRGLSSSSMIRLMLASPQNFKINEQLSIELPADGRNFIEFNCDGFSAINLKGNFYFNGMLVPDKELAQNEDKVRASFEINTRDLNNILTTVNITPFKLRGLDDLSFEVRNAVADFSDIVNPPGFIFPQGYQQAFGSDITLWRGFYLQNVAVRIKGFAGEPGQDPTIEATNLLIDDLGVTGVFSASNILSLHKGSADGWPLSVDRFMVTLLNNKVTGGGIGGQIIIPFLGDTPVAYTAQVAQGDRELNYLFTIDTSKPITFRTPMGAYINIDQGSTIALERLDGKFYPSALLHGTVSVKEEKIEGSDGSSGGNSPLQNIPVKVEKIRFENLGITSKKPYIVSGVFTNIGSQQAKLAGFKVRIEEVTLQVYDGRAGIGFDFALGFMESGDKGFSAGTYVQLLAKMEESQPPPTESGMPSGKSRQKWSFEKVKINDIMLDCRTQAFGLNGRLSIFDNDPLYGSGFHGSLAFTIKKILERGVQVNAYFGSKETFRYWHVDAYIPTAEIPIIPPVSMNGIMGGASYKMAKRQAFLPDFSLLTPENPGNLSTGNSNTSMAYVPDETAGMSFMAGLTLIVARENAINGDVMLEVAFNQGGGIRYAQFTGTAFFFTAVKDRGRTQGGNAPAAPVYASLNMIYDNDNDVFHANLKTFLNMSGVIQGTGPNGMVGEAVIHVDRRDWYVYIGRSSQMLGVNVANLATANAYFMLGTKLENIPLPPQEVRDIFGKIDLSMMRDDMAAAGGSGIAAGVHFKVGFDSGQKLKPFYAMMVVGAGADIMLRNYGNVQCAGRSGKIGMNGWYASGQAYVFLKGKVGIVVKSTAFDIVDLGVAALLQAKLPNPAWMSGQLAGQYRVLGGLVKGRFNLSFNVGEECELISPGDDISEIYVISDLKPDNGGTALSVFTAPQVSFNTSIDTEFTMEDMLNKFHTYRVKMEEFKIMHNGSALQGNIKWNSQKDVAVFKTTQILPPNANLRATVKVFWQKKSPNGIWETIKDTRGRVIYEERQISFSTSEAPKFVPEENVAYSYPIKYQYNLHADETNKGYIKLDQGQDYLFKGRDENGTWEFYAKFRDNKGTTSVTALAYDFATATLNFNFPNAFEKNAIYSLTVIKKLKDGEVDKNVRRDEIKRVTDQDNELSIANNTLEGTITQSSESVLYQTVFRTSQYGKFSERWAALSNSTDAFDVAKGFVAVIGKRSSSQEVFDEFETNGKGEIQPLVQVIASPENRWFKNIISPLIYDLYPYDNKIRIEWRETAKLGVKPLKGVQLTSNINNLKLTDADVSSGYAQARGGSVLVGYYLSYYAFWDYKELIDKVAASYPDLGNNRPAGIKTIMAAKGYTDLLEDNYPVDIQYVMPGTNRVIYKGQISIKF